MPYFYLPSYCGGEVSTGRCECESGHCLSECEMEKDYSARDIRQDCTAILVDGQEELSVGTEREAGNVLSVGEGEGMCL